VRSGCVAECVPGAFRVRCRVRSGCIAERTAAALRDSAHCTMCKDSLTLLVTRSSLPCTSRWAT
jgi:hypothetical protein